jgi:hypothetical protein
MLSTNIHTGSDNPKSARSNKIMVSTKYSQDGRSTEVFWLDYNPSDSLALFLFEKTLNSSDYVDFYRIFDTSGDRVLNPSKEVNPKRT